MKLHSLKRRAIQSKINSFLDTHVWCRIGENQKLNEIDGEGQGKGEAIFESRLNLEDWQMAMAIAKRNATWLGTIRGRMSFAENSRPEGRYVHYSKAPIRNIGCYSPSAVSL
jgi:hypothetical protein